MGIFFIIVAVPVIDIFVAAVAVGVVALVDGAAEGVVVATSIGGWWSKSPFRSGAGR